MNIRDRFFEYVSSNEKRAELGALAVLAGLLIEVFLAFKFRTHKSFEEEWGPVLADVLIATGIYAEILFGRRASGESAKKVSEANERAAKADLARVELEKKLRARSISKEQYETLEKLKGQISEIRIAFDNDPEPIWFAQLLASVLLKIGITVSLLPRDPGFKSSANILCDKRAFSNPDGAPTGEPLAAIFNEAGIPVAILAGYPMDLRGEWSDDVPMIVIGSRVLPPEPAYLGPGLMDAKAP